MSSSKLLRKRECECSASILSLGQIESCSFLELLRGNVLTVNEADLLLSVSFSFFIFHPFVLISFEKLEHKRAAEKLKKALAEAKPTIDTIFLLNL